ncbi:hypothetical protein PPERSA_07183 [Pseudocohnilembus persalinus]|uniref:Uncharacterized protein n=1 Tax=Pseudocohnilembus persalinus TaxID=266149 RepID=A0A0V0QXB5_PSEPJ|nr:hypothetical protein PPERSA_07183 [Pseudocohnilembus persalinus]|eukprot:KRX07020.1 hypothetical protein PPERSA_07183 [Pseudocohnilembus persalinus]
MGVYQNMQNPQQYPKGYIPPAQQQFQQQIQQHEQQNSNLQNDNNNNQQDNNSNNKQEGDNKNIQNKQILSYFLKTLSSQKNKERLQFAITPYIICYIFDGWLEQYSNDTQNESVKNVVNNKSEQNQKNQNYIAYGITYEQRDTIIQLMNQFKNELNCNQLNNYNNMHYKNFIIFNELTCFQQFNRIFD